MEFKQSFSVEELQGKYSKEEIYTNYFLPYYQNLNYESTILAMIKKQIIPLEMIDAEVLTYLWMNYPTAKTIILEKVDSFILDSDYHKLTKLVELSMNSQQDFIYLCKKMLQASKVKIRILMIEVLLDLGFPASEELIIQPLYSQKKENPKMEKNSIFDVLEYHLNEKEIQDIILNHYEKLFESSIAEKMQILSTVVDLAPDVASELIKKYGILLSYFRQIPLENQKWADEILSRVIEDEKVELFLKNIKERFHGDRLVVNTEGSYSIVLGTKEWILKLSKERINWHSPRESFLLNPSEFHQILDENGIPVAGIEWQENLPIVDRKITRELIYKYLLELKNQNLTITDSTCLSYQSNNFRFLKNVDFLKDKKIELPEWFVKNPIVLIDIDALYYRGQNKEADEKMDDVISNFKK